MQKIEIPENSLGPAFTIEYVSHEEMLLIDGVKVSPDAIRRMVVQPEADRWLKFERRDDVIHVQVYRSKQAPDA